MDDPCPLKTEKVHLPWQVYFFFFIFEMYLTRVYTLGPG
jgi:hypothetical protein